MTPWNSQGPYVRGTVANSSRFLRAPVRDRWRTGKRKASFLYIGEDVLSHCKAAFDAVYNPGKTKFLTLAASCGLKTVGGMGMLVCQAVAAHELWYGASFKDSDIEQLICDAEAETARLFRA